jgi:polysaccharide export outer membrane protein
MLKINLRIIGLALFISLFASSCITNKKLTYLQQEGLSHDTISSVTPADYRIQPFDNLFIRVVTPDPQLSAMFNTMPSNSQSVGTSEQSVDMLSYTVEADGAIQIPYAGKVKVMGLTMTAATEEVDKALKGYIADASVTVKMVNNYVSLIGEVQRPGRYPIYKSRMSIFQALALAGDLNQFSNRKKVQLIRQTPSGNVVKEFNLTDRSIMSSEYYYVMPNDVLYVPPVGGKFFRMDVFPYAIILSTVTTFILVLNYIK